VRIDSARADQSGSGVPGPLLQLLQLAVMARRAAAAVRARMRSEELGASDETQSMNMSSARFVDKKHEVVTLTRWPPETPFDQLQWLIGVCTSLRYRWPLPERFLASCYSMAHSKAATGRTRVGSPRDLILAQGLMTQWTRQDDASLVRWLREVAKLKDKHESDLSYDDWARPSNAHRTAHPLL